MKTLALLAFTAITLGSQAAIAGMQQNQVEEYLIEAQFQSEPFRYNQRSVKSEREPMDERERYLIEAQFQEQPTETVGRLRNAQIPKPINLI